jgi:hypothetical protein
MQAVSDCPQFGGVISRTVVLSRRSGKREADDTISIKTLDIAG